MLRRTLLAAAALLTLTAAHADSALRLEVYNPGHHSIFPVSSEIVSGRHEALLIDAQFQRNDAEALVRKLKAGGKTLTTVYISHSDPDYYFGLDVIQAAFPEARIVATASTVAAIRATMEGKLAYWGPLLKDNAPKKLVLPQVLEGDQIELEGQALQISGPNGAASERSYLWIPSLRTVAGGVVVSSGLHVWMADTQTPASRQTWLDTLEGIEALKPARLVPGHYLGVVPQGVAAAKSTAAYLKTFETEAARATDSAALVAAMKKAYPKLGEPDSLVLSAKVIKGEMRWPQ